MKSLAFALLVVLAPGAGPAAAQTSSGTAPSERLPGSGGPGNGGPVQHGAQPNPSEVRPGSRDGDVPSAAAGEVLRERERRILGLPVSAALVIGAAIVALLVLAGILIPASRRRERARGGGTYGRR